MDLYSVYKHTFPMGVNTLNMFVCFVRFFLMNKSYVFCAFVVITLYNNHTPTPPRPAEAWGIVTSFTGFYDFFWIFYFFSSLHNYWIYFITYLPIYDF